MDLVIKGKNMDVTEPLRDYAQQKLSRITKILDDIIDTQVEFNVIKNKSVQNNQIVQVTLHLSGGVIRAEEAKDNMYAAIDLVTDKIERQLRRFFHGQKYLCDIKRQISILLNHGLFSVSPVGMIYAPSIKLFKSTFDKPNEKRNVRNVNCQTDYEEAGGLFYEASHAPLCDIYSGVRDRDCGQPTSFCAHFSICPGGTG